MSIDRLKEYIRKVEGLRHGWENYDELEKRANFIEENLLSFGLAVENQKFQFHGKVYRNVIGTKKGSGEEKGHILLGAHYDAAWGSPGADDNASGVAVLLEVANVLKETNLRKSLEFVAFTLEEPQPHTIHFLIGSNNFVTKAKKSNKSYDAALILESVGYTDKTDRSQSVPALVRIQVPKTGDFLGVIANRKSANLMRVFCDISNQHVSGLKVIPYKVPLSGRLIPETRFSDHASFWNYRYPAIMLTDTAMFRNPHYHTHRDRYETLDFDFIYSVTKAVASVLVVMGNKE
ncbi:MAG: M28 family peptidase [Nitrospirota bacterium]